MIRASLRLVALVGACLVIVGMAQPVVAAPEEDTFAHAVVTVAQADTVVVDPSPVFPAPLTPRGAYVTFVTLSCTPSPLIPTDPCVGFGTTS